MSDDFSDKVVAIVGDGSDEHRALAVRYAEAGAAIALASVDRSQEQEFAVNSIANEIWSIGREHFVRVMDSADATAAAAFADETWDRLGRCDLLITLHSLPNSAPLDEFSADEWDTCVRVMIDGPFLAGQAFARYMDRQGGGAIELRLPAGDDMPSRAAAAALAVIAEAMDAAWSGRSVSIRASNS